MAAKTDRGESGDGGPPAVEGRERGEERPTPGGGQGSPPAPPASPAGPASPSAKAAADDSKPALRNSCEACTAARKRCQTPGPPQPCARCLRLGFPCEFLAPRKRGPRGPWAHKHAQARRAGAGARSPRASRARGSDPGSQGTSEAAEGSPAVGEAALHPAAASPLPPPQLPIFPALHPVHPQQPPQPYPPQAFPAFPPPPDSPWIPATTDYRTPQQPHRWNAPPYQPPRPALPPPSSILAGIPYPAPQMPGASFPPMGGFPPPHPSYARHASYPGATPAPYAHPGSATEGPHASWPPPTRYPAPYPYPYAAGQGQGQGSPGAQARPAFSTDPAAYQLGGQGWPPPPRWGPS